MQQHLQTPPAAGPIGRPTLDGHISMYNVPRASGHGALERIPGVRLTQVHAPAGVAPGGHLGVQQVPHGVRAEAEPLQAIALLAAAAEGLLPAIEVDVVLVLLVAVQGSGLLPLLLLAGGR